MPGFSFQYFCYFVANLTWGFSWVVFGLFLPALSRVRLWGQMYRFVQGEWERTEVRKDSATTVSGLYLPLLPWDETCAHGLLSVCWLSIRCSRNVGKKPPRNVMRAEHLCSVEIWACRQRNGLCESGDIVFFQRTFFHNTLVFSFSLEVKVGHIDGSWPSAWKENGWRERWRRVVLKLWRK